MKKLLTTLTILALATTLIYAAKTRAQTEEMKTFFDSEILGIKIQVNATSETQPGQNITAVLNMTAQALIEVENFNFSIYGFVNGTSKVLLQNITEGSFTLNASSKDYNCTFKVPEQVWDTTYGEIKLTYSMKLWGFQMNFTDTTRSFAMTFVKNVYLENLENELAKLKDDYQSLNETYWSQNQTYDQLNKTYWELYGNYTSLKGSAVELDNTRRVVAVLAVATVLFVATTVYLITRKPKTYW